MIRRRVVVHGHVQGVYFRESVRRLAVRSGVAGWIQNNPDGSVEALFEGEPESVERLVVFCREGPRGALVGEVDVYVEDVAGLDGFSIR
jgi:acylphosphatase